jgi:hypothetical protein
VLKGPAAAAAAAAACLLLPYFVLIKHETHLERVQAHLAHEMVFNSNLARLNGLQGSNAAAMTTSMSS